jgi:hypothetical protein
VDRMHRRMADQFVGRISALKCGNTGTEEAGDRGCEAGRERPLAPRLGMRMTMRGALPNALRSAYAEQDAVSMRCADATYGRTDGLTESLWSPLRENLSVR